MSFKLPFFISFFSLLLVSQSISQFSAIESFDYPLGTSMDTLIGTATDGWAGSWRVFDGNDSSFNVSDTGFVSDDLNYVIPNSGHQVYGLNVAAWQGQRIGRELDKLWPDEGGNEYWISFIIELSHNFSDNGWAGVGLFLNDTTWKEQRLFGHEWGNPNYCMSLYDTLTYSQYSWDSGPQWLVVRMIMSGDTSAEKAYMWVTPDPAGSEPDTAAADVKGEFELNDGFDVVGVHFGNENVGTKMAVDEIRLGTTWASVSSDFTSGIEKNSQIPNRLVLAQNYPNPFNPSTKIQYQVKKSGNVKLAVYNLAGKEVDVLVNKHQVQGSYIVDYSAKGLASGIYFYKLFSADGSVTKKMALIK